MEEPKLNAVGKPYSPQYDPNYKVRGPGKAHLLRPQKIRPVKGWEYRNGKVAVADVIIPKGRRALDADTVASLASSIQKIGLQCPITVRKSGEAYTLIAGLHRLEAVRSLGDALIPAVVSGLDRTEARLWEISENLHRSELTALERSKQVAEWIRLTETVSRQVDAKPQGGRPEGGVRAASRELGISEPDARRAVIVDSIEPEAQEAAREAGLDDNQSALLKVAAEEPEAQVAKVAEIAEAKKKPRKARLDDEMPSEEEADDSYQETLYDQARMILESMSIATRRKFFAQAEAVDSGDRLHELECTNIALQSEVEELKARLAELEPHKKKMSKGERASMEWWLEQDLEWRNLWKSEGRSLIDWEAGLSDGRSAVWDWRRAKGEEAWERETQAWVADHPGMTADDFNRVTSCAATAEEEAEWLTWRERRAEQAAATKPALEPLPAAIKAADELSEEEREKLVDHLVDCRPLVDGSPVPPLPPGTFGTLREYADNIKARHDSSVKAAERQKQMETSAGILLSEARDVVRRTPGLNWHAFVTGWCDMSNRSANKLMLQNRYAQAA